MVNRQPRIMNPKRNRLILNRVHVPSAVFKTIHELATMDNASISSVVADILCDFFGINSRTGKPYKNGHAR